MKVLTDDFLNFKIRFSTSKYYYCTSPKKKSHNSSLVISQC